VAVWLVVYWGVSYFRAVHCYIGEKFMNPVVKAQLKAFEKANPGTAMDESSLFEVFAIHSISNGILNDNIDPFRAQLGGKEFGIDGIAIMVQGELCPDADEVTGVLESGKNHQVEFNLFQAKTSEKLDYGDLSKFFDGAYNFFVDKLDNPSNRFLDLLSAKSAVYSSALKQNPTLRLFFASTGSAEQSKPITQLVESNRTRFNDLNIFNEVEIALLGAKELQAGYRAATNSVSGKIEILKPVTLPEHKSVQQAFLGFVEAQQLVQLASTPTADGTGQRINKAVFFDNIRDFDAKSVINKTILSDLESGNQSSFVFKNNGVTVVAKTIRRQSDVFELDDFQIVNGCQTTNILSMAGDHAKDTFVPFRLIGSDDPDFVASIIVGTNKQNEVRDDQFLALSPFMKNLEEFCKQQEPEQKVFVERRENQYRDEAIERTRICKPRDLVKCIAATFLFQPHRAARDYRGVTNEFSKQIFQENHSVIPYHAAAIANYRIDFLTRNKRIEGDWRIFKYYVLSSIGSKATKGATVFNLRKGEQDAVSRAIIDLCSNEDKLVEHYAMIANILEQMIDAAKIDTRERVRDYIRSDAVFKDFESKLKPEHR
jgi:AIPR protein